MLAIELQINAKARSHGITQAQDSLGNRPAHVHITRLEDTKLRSKREEMDLHHMMGVS